MPDNNRYPGISPYFISKRRSGYAYPVKEEAAATEEKEGELPPYFS